MSESWPLTYPLSSADVAELVHASVPAAPSDVLPARPHEACVVAIGAFDGLHRAHRALIQACIAEASAQSATSVVVTFDPDPSELLLGDEAERRLLSVDDRSALAFSLGVDDVLVVPFTSELAQLSAEAFIDYLLEQLGPIACMHVGANFHFGHHGTADVAALAGIGEQRHFRVVAHPLIEVDGAPVSSTRIRALLAGGDVAGAAALLERPHFIRGAVMHGRGEGTSFGFPTANIRCDQRSCMPGEGVYACLVTDGSYAWPAAANVGAPPTFDTQRDSCFLEANLIGFEGDLYGRELAVVFLEWLRASRPFSSLEELERVVLGNIDWVRCNVGPGRVEVRA